MALIFIDLDGTLLTKGNTVEDSFKILDELERKGYKICIATGRPLKDVTKLGILDNRQCYLMLENGGMIGVARGNEFKPFEEWQESISAQIGEMKALADKLSKGHTIIRKDVGFSIETYDDVTIPEEFPNSKVQRNHDTLDFMPKIAGKKQAAEFLMNKLNLSTEDITHIGDSMNDYDLLAFAGTSATVGNADDAVKELVRTKGGFIATQPETEGVKEILKEL